jgi:hypothetical protein
LNRTSVSPLSFVFDSSRAVNSRSRHSETLSSCTVDGTVEGLATTTVNSRKGSRLQLKGTSAFSTLLAGRAGLQSVTGGSVTTLTRNSGLHSERRSERRDSLGRLSEKGSNNQNGWSDLMHHRFPLREHVPQFVYVACTLHQVDSSRLSFSGEAVRLGGNPIPATDRHVKTGHHTA